jgi:short chain dehydrogenase
MLNVIVTGGSRGLGLAIARRLAASGYRVMAIARRETDETRSPVREWENVEKGGDIERLVLINTLSPIILTKFVVRTMMAEVKGRIVNVSSVIGQTGYSGLSAYGATKASIDLGPRRKGPGPDSSKKRPPAFCRATQCRECGGVSDKRQGPKYHWNHPYGGCGNYRLMKCIETGSGRLSHVQGAEEPGEHSSWV